MMTCIKKALMREPGYAVGTAAPLYLNCFCETKVRVVGELLICQFCGQAFDRQGYVINASEIRTTYPSLCDCCVALLRPQVEILAGHAPGSLEPYPCDNCGRTAELFLTKRKERAQ